MTQLEILYALSDAVNAQHVIADELNSKYEKIKKESVDADDKLRAMNNSLMQLKIALGVE